MWEVTIILLLSLEDILVPLIAKVIRITLVASITLVITTLSLL